MNPADLNVAVLAVTAVLLLGVAAIKITTRAGLPSLLVYLGIGLLIGEAGLGFSFDSAEVTQTLGSVALAIILAEGGLTTRMSVVRPALSLAVVLATVGVAISVTVTSLLAWLMLDIDPRTAILLGAAVSSTDAAAVFAVMRTMRLRPRTRAALEAESGFNDPPVIILVTLVVSEAWNNLNPLMAVVGFVQQMGLGLLAGVVVALGGAFVLRRLALPAAGLYPLAIFALTMLGYGVAGVIGGSPFVAVYVAGLILGNANLPHRSASMGFAEGLAWLSQIGLFIMLGLLASPARLLDALLPALAVGIALTLIARPISVLLCATPFKVPIKEQTFISWAGLRGAVPIVLATFPITAAVPQAEKIFDIVFLLVVMFTLLQGPTLPWLASRLGMLEPTQADELEIEIAPFEKLGATMLSFDVPEGSKLAGVHLPELRLPGDAVINLILRNGDMFVPGPDTTLRTGDHLLIAVGFDKRKAVERRLRAISRAGRLAGWRGERGQVI